MKKIICVCTGNSCRSVMAWALLDRIARERHLPIEVSSAGVSPVDGMRPSRETRELLLREGIDVSEHRAVRLTEEMIREADVMLVMERFHRSWIIDHDPSALTKTFLLTDYGQAGGETREIIDPISKPMEVYEVCLATIKEAVERVAKTVCV